ncbi:hypothetical protein BN59_01831 [Legionella massiliensis]|uniref:Uncharacterized protein n=1 Tax=Legionella massiliensis TaxID=1034943 RepID=A0A078L0L6_9GAMM|nr:hypothetical protein [Legionella massiliensis]CDZ77548.1 hypothetical protein BN59_01831 [Legionella massiliensis]CEE13286.1 hypothetical protein BN1094_01831 [Legionella massiliensis]
MKTEVNQTENQRGEQKKNQKKLLEDKKLENISGGAWAVTKAQIRPTKPFRSHRDELIK